MFDRILEAVVVIGPTAFAIVVEVVSGKVRESPSWKRGVVVFGIILSVLTYCQIERQETKASASQETLQAENRKAEERFSNDLDDVKRSNDAILSFVSNPPKGVTQEQLTQFVKAFVQDRQTPVPDQLAGMPTDSLISTAATAVAQLNELEGEWEHQDRTDHEIPYVTGGSLAKQEIAQEKTAETYRSKTKDTIKFVSDLRNEILKRFPSQPDPAADALFIKLSRGTYDFYDLSRAMADLSSLLSRVSVANKPAHS